MKARVSKDIFEDFDFSRSDKLYSLHIPAYRLQDDIVYYNFQLKDLIRNQSYTRVFRYNQLKFMHKQLSTLNYEMPPFPVTHFWSKTNKKPHLIEERRIGLESYFSKVINDPNIRGYREVKKIIALCKAGSHGRRRLSEDKKTQRTTWTRTKSMNKNNEAITMKREEWKKLVVKSPKKTDESF